MKIYSPLSQHHGYYGLIISGPNEMHLYTILFQENMVKRNFAFNELERIN